MKNIRDMLYRYSYYIFLLLLYLAPACNQGQAVKEPSKEVASDSRIVTLQGPEVEPFVSFIAGMPYGNKQGLQKLDSLITWKNYAAEYDSLFAYAGRLRINNMRNWADSELIRDTTVTTLFYPFSGPDFITSEIFYPGIKQFILVGLEPLGELPDLTQMKPDSVRDFMNSMNNTLNDLLVRSYFITSKMNNDLRKAKVNGVIPMLSVFIERTGHHLVSIRRVGVDSLGNCLVADSLKNRTSYAEGVKMDFRSTATNKTQSVTYFRADLSNKGLKNSKGFRAYLSRIPLSYSFLKSAAFLMYSHNFKVIRDLIFDKSETILQDDSGIAFRDFNRSKWEIRLFGKFSKPKNELSFYRESSLVEAFRHTKAKPLPFSLGYNWGTDHTCMIYAIRK